MCDVGCGEIETIRQCPKLIVKAVNFHESGFLKSERNSVVLYAVLYVHQRYLSVSDYVYALVYMPKF